MGWLLIRTGESREVLKKTVRHEIESLGHEYAPEIRTIEQTTGLILTEERVTALHSGHPCRPRLGSARMVCYNRAYILPRTRESDNRGEANGRSTAAYRGECESVNGKS
jgi:hypothetical protein